MKKFIAEPSFWNIFPNAKIGVLTITNVNETAQLTEQEKAEIANLLEQANQIAKKYVPNEPISENPVVATWRKAYQSFPTKKGARCSIEALLKRVLHGNPVNTIAPSVDITNAISLKYAFPIGAEDMDTFDGDIKLGCQKGGEDFLPIGSEQQEPPLPNELAYYDDFGVICRCWNWRDGQRTQITDHTTSEFIAMECIEEDRYEDLAKALDELETLLCKYLKVKVITKVIIDKDNPTCNINE